MDLEKEISELKALIEKLLVLTTPVVITLEQQQAITDSLQKSCEDYNLRKDTAKNELPLEETMI